MLRLRRHAPSASRARRRASPPRAPPAWPGANWSQFGRARLSQVMQADRCPPISSTKTGSASASADPEAAGHVDELVARAGVGADEHRLQRHAADRAGARADLADLGVHRAGVDRALGHRLGLGRRGRRVEVAGGVGDELRAAAGRAEGVGMAVVLGAVLGRVRIDGHAADRILDCVGAVGRSWTWIAVGLTVVRVRRCGRRLGPGACCARW